MIDTMYGIPPDVPAIKLKILVFQGTHPVEGIKLYQREYFELSKPYYDTNNWEVYRNIDGARWSIRQFVHQMYITPEQDLEPLSRAAKLLSYPV